MSADDPFALLDLPRRHTLDRAALEERYRELSAAAHPDRVVAEGPAARREAVERASRINAAYRVLRDPVLRAEALVRLGGVDLESTDPERGAPRPSQAFLLEIIDLRERLEEAGPAAAALQAEVEARAEAALQAAVAALDDDDVPAAARHLVARRYFQRFLEEADARA